MDAEAEAAKLAAAEPTLARAGLIDLRQRMRQTNGVEGGTAPTLSDGRCGRLPAWAGGVGILCTCAGAPGLPLWAPAALGSSRTYHIPCRALREHCVRVLVREGEAAEAAAPENEVCADAKTCCCSSRSGNCRVRCSTFRER